MPSSTQLVVPTRRPLSEVSGNGPSAARKRFKQGKTELEESLELAPFRGLPVSSFGRKRMAPQRAMQ